MFRLLKYCTLSLAIAVFVLGLPVRGARAATDLASLAARLAPAVVNISTSQTIKGNDPQDDEAGNTGPPTPFDRFFKDFLTPDDSGKGSGRKARALGSGFIIDGSGLVVTNNHVIADADEITVVLQDNTELKAELVGRDADTDVALLRVKPDHPLPAVQFGSSDKLRVGDWVIAVGNPYGLGGTVTAGILSARARQISNNGPYDNFLQTDAAINRGNSGGPLFNQDGEVIGINSAIISPSGGSIGLGFAIPSELASHVVAALKRDGRVRRGYLGARIEGLTDDTAAVFGLPRTNGVLVSGVPSDSPAMKAGLQAGDIVVSVSGKEIDGVAELQRQIADAPIGQAVAMGIWRQHALQAIPVNLKEAADADRPQQGQASAGSGKLDLSVLQTLGLTLSIADSELKEKFQLDDSAHIVVTDIRRTGPAADKGIKPGDVVVEVAHKEIKNLDDVTKTVSEVKRTGLKSILLLIDRGGDLRFVDLRLDQGEPGKG